MTLYQAIKNMKELGWKFVRHYGDYELWDTGKGYVSVPNQNIVPKYIERTIKHV